MSTIRDVAQAAGVSVATVSRALRGVDRVRPQTRERIQRLAAELDFVASPAAVSLASGRTRVIAVVAPSRTRWYFATLVRGIDRRLRQHDHLVFLVDLEDEGYNPRLRLSQTMLLKRADGSSRSTSPLTRRTGAARPSRPSSCGCWDPCSGPLAGSNRRRPHSAHGHRTPHRARPQPYRLHRLDAGRHRPDQAPQQRLHGFEEAIANHGLSCPPHCSSTRSGRPFRLHKQSPSCFRHRTVPRR